MDINNRGRTKLFKHFNDEGDTRPVNQKPHRLTVAQKKHLNNEIQQIIEENFHLCHHRLLWYLRNMAQMDDVLISENLILIQERTLFFYSELIKV